MKTKFVPEFDKWAYYLIETLERFIQHAKFKCELLESLCIRLLCAVVSARLLLSRMRCCGFYWDNKSLRHVSLQLMNVFVYGRFELVFCNSFAHFVLISSSFSFLTSFSTGLVFLWKNLVAYRNWSLAVFYSRRQERQAWSVLAGRIPGKRKTNNRVVAVRRRDLYWCFDSYRKVNKKVCMSAR